MKRLLCILFVLALGTTGLNAYKSSATNEVEVYICTGPQSKRYHKTSSCKGLKSCSREIVKVPLKKAKDLGRTPCGYCYK